MELPTLLHSDWRHHCCSTQSSNKNYSALHRIWPVRHILLKTHLHLDIQWNIIIKLKTWYI